MVDVGQTLGVQSFCFRNSETGKDVAARVKECGLSDIELCALHWDVTAPETFDDGLKVYSDAGVNVCSIGLYVFKGDAYHYTDAISDEATRMIESASKRDSPGCHFRDIFLTPSGQRTILYNLNP